jgi:hypothetical protein
LPAIEAAQRITCVSRVSLTRPCYRPGRCHRGSPIVAAVLATDAGTPDRGVSAYVAVRSRAGRRGDDWGGDERRRESRFGNRRELDPERPREPRPPMSNAHPSGVVRSSEPFGSCLLPKSAPVRQYNSGGCHLAPAHRLARSGPELSDRGEAFSDRGSAERAGRERARSRQVSLWCEREPMGQSGELLESFRSIDYEQTAGGGAVI